MGAIVKVTCSSCSTKWQCITGCGIMHGTLEAVAALFPKDIQKEIKDCVGDTMFPLFDFEYQLSYCEHCGGITSVPVIKFPEARAEFIGNCNQCGKKASLIENMESLPCPACHKESLTADEIGAWD